MLIFLLVEIEVSTTIDIVTGVMILFAAALLLVLLLLPWMVMFLLRLGISWFALVPLTRVGSRIGQNL